jgi:uncharacterized protein YecT (DUF1311 family)
MKKLLIVALVAFTPTLAFGNSNAKLDRIERELQACMSEEGGHSTQGEIACFIAGHGKADKLLNVVYQQLVKSNERDADRGKERNLRLRNAQRAWIPARDADCRLEGATMLNGSGENVLVHGCHYRKTAERVRYLEANQ